MQILVVSHNFSLVIVLEILGVAILEHFWNASKVKGVFTCLAFSTFEVSLLCFFLFSSLRYIENGHPMFRIVTIQVRVR